MQKHLLVLKKVFKFLHGMKWRLPNAKSATQFIRIVHYASIRWKQILLCGLLVRKWCSTGCELVQSYVETGMEFILILQGKGLLEKVKQVNSALHAQYNIQYTMYNKRRARTFTLYRVSTNERNAFDCE